MTNIHSYLATQKSGKPRWVKNMSPNLLIVNQIREKQIWDKNKMCHVIIQYNIFIKH